MLIKSFVILSFALLIIIPNTILGQEKSSDSYERFISHIEKKEYYKACLLLNIVLEEFKNVGEGASHAEYNRLLGVTAGSGQHDWVKIFMEAKIPLQFKKDLVEEIHTNATIK